MRHYETKPITVRMEVYAGTGDHDLPNGGYVRNGSGTAGTVTIVDGEGNTVTISNVTGGQLIDWIMIQRVTAIATLSNLEIYHFQR
jgi:hypothetical protein